MRCIWVRLRGPILKALFGRDNLIKFTFWLRFASKPNPIRYIAKHEHRRMMQKYGLQIPYNTQILVMV